MAIIAVLTSDLVRNRPRTCTAEIANEANSVDNSLTYVADLAINPETGQADFSNSVPILPYPGDPAMLRENMKQLLDLILSFFQDENSRVESGELQVEDQLLSPYVRENHPNTQHNIRPIPENFKRRRA